MDQESWIKDIGSRIIVGYLKDFEISPRIVHPLPSGSFLANVALYRLLCFFQIGTIKGPDKLLIENIDLANLNIWLDAFDDFVDLSYDKIDDNKKVKLFLTVAGIETRRIASTLTLADNKFSTLVDAIRRYVQPVKSALIARHKFFARFQSLDEDISSYVSVLKHLANDCDFFATTVDTLENQLIRDQVIRNQLITNQLITDQLII